MKKKTALLVFMIALVVTGIVGAEGLKRGGYTGPSSVSISKASEVKTMPHDADVVLEGRIESYLGNEKYLFNDGSGTVILEIDNDEWNGLEVGADDVVIIYGEVDKKLQRIEIEVEKIEKQAR
ncbi:MAG: NirD/YgiW/YdeI family stress tolerance protein [Treponema sp.]|jgi:uncharacterized protein (TIGR00156 family)|nr:NirD/YgiW/YdeI family stress tolerance protein [Treponema sp.]